VQVLRANDTHGEFKEKLLSGNWMGSSDQHDPGIANLTNQALRATPPPSHRREGHVSVTN
jgi:hypothetical protein